MTIDNETMDILEKRFDERYVRQSTCNDVQSKNSKRFADDDKRIELIQHDFSAIKKLVWVIATASIGSLITAIFELIGGGVVIWVKNAIIVGE